MQVAARASLRLHLTAYEITRLKLPPFPYPKPMSNNDPAINRALEAASSSMSTGQSPQPELPPEALERGTSLWVDAWHRLRRHWAAMIGAGILCVMMGASLTAPWIARWVTGFAFDEQHLLGYARPPGARSVPRLNPTYDPDLRFEHADLNHDDKVSADELQTILSLAEFSRFDTDQDRRLSPDEIADAPVYRIDLPGEGDTLRLTIYAAYIMAMEQRFDALDLDHDHHLSPSELETSLTPAADAPQHIRLFTTILQDAARDPEQAQEHKALHRHEIRLRGRALLDAACVDLAACPLQADGAAFLTDIFPLSQSRDFIRSLDTNSDGALQPFEFQGVPVARTHWLGTDESGRDLLTRLLYGGRISFAVGLLATLVSLVIGVTWGATAGYLGGKVDNVMMRVVDILYGLPFMFLVILLMVVFGRDIKLLFIALGAVQWLTMSRIVRGQVMSLKRREFVEAARAIGVSGPRIVLRHLIPNALGPIIVYATLMVPAVMLEEAFLSFLGLGVQAPMASFGTLVSAGAEDMATYPWLILYPGLVLAVTLLSLNFVGDGLRDALDPQARKA